jgi:raffinose/stachyose/melibiose transport system substrate-binding protein
MIAKTTSRYRARRPTRVCSLTLGATVLVGSMGATISTTAMAATTSGIPNLTYSGTISMYAGAYNPPLPGIKLAPGTVANDGMAKAAAAFEKMYPNIKITFVPGSATIGTNAWYIAESAAGSLPDISEVPGYYVNVSLPVGIFQNLLPAFEKPNPFSPGNTSWISTMDPYALRIDTVPGNTSGTTGIFVVNGDAAGIGFYYNKNLFREAGIAAPPTSWLQLEADSTQIDSRLSSRGIYAGASLAPVIYNWFAHIFQTNYIGLARQQLLAALPVTLASAWPSYFYDHDGDFLNPVKNPALTAWFPAGKAVIDTWDPKDIDVPENTATTPDGVQFFLGQQVAYVFTQGYSMPNEIAALPKSQQFPIGYFEITNLDGTSPYATSLQTWQDNGGPATGFQFAIASSKADRSMTAAKSQAALAWLQFISTPQWDSNIVNAGDGSTLPIIKGATAPPALEPILKEYDSLANVTFGVGAFFDSLTDSSFYEIDGLYLEYVDGYISLQKAVSEYDSDAASIMQTFNSQHSVAIAKLTAYENKALGIGG